VQFVFCCLAAFSALLFSSCSKEQPVLTLNPSSITLLTGDYRQIFADTNEPLTFVSGREHIATVDNVGVVTGHLVGSTEITVTAPFATAVVPVTVMPLYTFLPDLAVLVGGPAEDVVALFGQPDNIAAAGDELLFEYAKYDLFVTDLAFAFVGGVCTGAFFFVEDCYHDIVLAYLRERYVPIGTSGVPGRETFVFNDLDVRVTVSLSGLYTGHSSVTYNPNMATL